MLLTLRTLHESMESVGLQRGARVRSPLAWRWLSLEGDQPRASRMAEGLGKRPGVIQGRRVSWGVANILSG